MPTTQPVSSLIFRAQVRNLALAGVSGLLALILVYLTLVRPFTAGFDLVSIQDDATRPVAQLINDRGENVQNQLTGVTGLILDGIYRDSTATIEAVEQVVGQDQPQIFGVEIRGTNQDTLIIGQVGRDGSDRTYVVDQGFVGQLGNDGVSAHNLRINPQLGIFQTSGPTTVTQNGSELRTDKGVRVTRDGDLEIGRQ